ncbi:hypothetical protein PAMP_016794 [Pampus punctatissimus]
MADTPLPHRCASCALFLLFATNSAALRAGSPFDLKAEIFRRVSVPSVQLCGGACPYLDRLSCGELRVLSACFESSAPLPPRLLRHLYRDRDERLRRRNYRPASCSSLSCSHRHI